MAKNKELKNSDFSYNYIINKTLKAGLILAVLYVISRADYLLFHSIAEFLTAVVSITIFLFVWNSRKFTGRNFYTIIGSVFFISGLLTILHALAYKGMGVFGGTGSDPNLATQLWLANQYVLAIGFIAAPFFLGRKPNARVAILVSLAVATLILLSILYWKIFPTAYVAVSGITAFKKYSEYVVAVFFLLSGYLFFQKRDQLDPKIVKLFYLICGLLFLSTILFTLYVGVYDSFNMIGHLLRLAAIYPVYIGIVEFGLMKPYNFLFGNLKDREESIKKNEKMFRAVVEDQTELICRFLPDGTLTFVNDAYCRYYGMARGYLIGKKYFGHIPKDVAEGDKKHLGHLSKDNPVAEIEHRAIDKNGWHRWQHWTTRAIFGGNNNVIEYQSVGRDITEQKFAEESLRKSEEKYRNLVDNSLVGIYRLDKDGNYTYVNEAMAKMFEFDSPDEMIRENVKGRYKNIYERTTFLELIRKKGKLSNYETEGMTKNGKKIVVLASVTLEGDEISGIVTDITKRREAEEAAIRAKEEWEKTFDSVPDLIAVLDNQHRIVRMNKAMAERLGLDSRKYVGQRCFECVHDANRPIANCPHSLTLADGKEHVAEVEEKNLRGTFLVSTTPLFAEDGKLAGSVHVARDITERKIMEKAKDEFISLASHQLKTPLSSIALSTELLLRGVVGGIEPEPKKYMKEIFKATKRMTLLINNLLNVSRVEMGNFQIRSDFLDAVSAVREIVRGLVPLAAEKQLEIEKKIDRDIAPIKFDANSFGIIFENILSNAIRYTPSGGKISIELADEKEGVLLVVSDTGCGIPEDQKRKIFGKSFRAENAKEVSSEGAGLGLYMTKIAAERGGAKIWFDSRERKGTTFFVLFAK
ncbi:MAG TPA: MASE3 domain-containing protein [Candidatus Bathyarchaeia archaeon]|nr:MASE3 domain-containing protein [Candidatus Bathyarchaeia archaeon]